MIAVGHNSDRIMLRFLVYESPHFKKITLPAGYIILIIYLFCYLQNKPIYVQY